MGKRKEFTGTVVSNKMEKTIVVRIMHLAKHPKYGRVMRRYNKYKAHDEKKTAKIGDMVKIRETRPLSKDKRFILVGVVKKSPLHGVVLKDDVNVAAAAADKGA